MEGYLKNVLEEYKPSYITVRARRLDKLLGGGVPLGSVVEVYGPSGTGKTQLCHQLAVNVQLPREDGGLQGKAAYIDTEGKFRPRRIESIARFMGVDPESVLTGILVARVFTMDAFERAVVSLEKLVSYHKVKLVVVDAFSQVLREAFERGGHLAKYEAILRYLAIFRRLARPSRVAVVLIDHAIAKMDDPLGFDSAGGRWVRNLVDIRIRIERLDGKMLAKLEFAPHVPPGEATFIIDKTGIVDAE